MPDSLRQPLRILIVDDDPDVRAALRLVLAQQPEVIGVSEAYSLRELLKLLESEAFDVILLDWELFRQTAADIRVEPLTIRRHWPDIVIVALSARPESRTHALANGATTFVSKGDAPERLIAAVCHR